MWNNPKQQKTISKSSSHGGIDMLFTHIALELYYYIDLTPPQSFQPVAAPLSLKAGLPYGNSAISQ